MTKPRILIIEDKDPHRPRTGIQAKGFTLAVVGIGSH
jgi:hypothetical protein